MSRFRQRLHSQYSSGGVQVIREAITSKQFAPSPGLALADVNARGFWAYDGVGAFDAALNPTMYSMTLAGQLRAQIDPAGAINTDFGEWYNDDSIVTDYPAQVLASRILRSEIMLDYELLGSVVLPISTFSIIPYDPLTGYAAAAIAFVVAIANPATYLFSEGALAPGGIGTAFVNERDAMCNKVKISAVRVNAGQKNFVVNWWDRTAGAMQTATLNWIAAGVGDQALLWAIQMPNAGGLPTHSELLVRNLLVSDGPITYGNAPV